MSPIFWPVASRFFLAIHVEHRPWPYDLLNKRDGILPRTVYVKLDALRYFKEIGTL